MTNEKILEILKKIKADPKVREQQNGKPVTPEEMISVLAEIAEKKGYDITAEDIGKVLEQEKAKMKEKTDKAAAQVIMLDDDDLQNVVGGEGVETSCGNPMDEVYESNQLIQCLFNDICGLIWN